MSRRRTAPKREMLPDTKFNSNKLAKFINYVMEKGKKSIAEGIVYGSFEIAIKDNTVKNKDEIKKVTRSNENSDSNKDLILLLLDIILDNVSPSVEVRSRRVGGSTYQIPVEVRYSRRQALGMRWIIGAAKNRNEKTMKLRLANEIIDAASGRGSAVKKRDDMYRMTKANQAFSHYKW